MPQKSETWKKSQEEKSLHALTFPADYKGPAMRDVRLPGGAVVVFNRFQKDEAAADFPRVEFELTPRQARDYRASGFEVHAIKQRTKKAHNPLAAPPVVEPATEEG